MASQEATQANGARVTVPTCARILEEGVRSRSPRLPRPTETESAALPWRRRGDAVCRGGRMSGAGLQIAEMGASPAWRQSPFSQTRSCLKGQQYGNNSNKSDHGSSGLRVVAAFLAPHRGPKLGPLPTPAPGSSVSYWARRSCALTGLPVPAPQNSLVGTSCLGHRAFSVLWLLSSVPTCGHRRSACPQGAPRPVEKTEGSEPMAGPQGAAGSRGFVFQAGGGDSGSDSRQWAQLAVPSPIHHRLRGRDRALPRAGAQKMFRELVQRACSLRIRRRCSWWFQK